MPSMRIFSFQIRLMKTSPLETVLAVNEERLSVEKTSGNWFDGILPELLRDATPLAAPKYVLGTRVELSMVPYSRAVPVPFTRT